MHLTTDFGYDNEPNRATLERWLEPYDYFVDTTGVTFDEPSLNNNKVLGVLSEENSYFPIAQFLPFNIKTDVHTSIWDTRNTSTGSSDSDQIRLPITTGAASQDFYIAWGDGTSVQHITDGANAVHTYAVEGAYELQIYGEVNGFAFNNSGDRLKLTEIRAFGKEFGLSSSVGAFYGCNNLKVTASDLFATDSIYAVNAFRSCFLLTTLPDAFKFMQLGTTITYMFTGARLFNSNINNWDVSEVTNFSRVFEGTYVFNQPLDNWNVSNATNFNNLFSYAKAFNQPLNSWDTSNVTDMSFMFIYASKFNQPVDNWDTTKVTSIQRMFFCANDFDQDISWKPATTANVWTVDTAYSRLYQVLGTDGKVYRAKSAHTSTAATEPITGVDWATVWELDGGKWNLSNCTDFDYLTWNLNTFSTTNMDKFLIGLKAQDDAGWTIANNMSFRLNYIKYGADPDAITAFDWLTAPVASGGKGWTIPNIGTV
jgi:surface protein